MIASIQERLEKYNVTWDSPSRDSSGSMPIGNGNLAANVWVETNGDVLILLGKNDAWDENGALLKLARVRLSFSPNPILEGGAFRQVLNLYAGEIEIAMGSLRIRVSVDAYNPVIRIEADHESPFEMYARLEVWRSEARTIKTQTGDIFKNLTGTDPYPTIVSPDLVLPARENRIAWCHRNEARRDDGFEINMKLQGLGYLLGKGWHPLRGRTFGGAIEGHDFISTDATSLKSKSAESRHVVSIYGLSRDRATVEQWREALDNTIRVLARDSLDHISEVRRKWWEKYWNQSFIFVDAPDAFQLTQSYLLQRFMNACAGRGEFPIKHNGSLFSVGQDGDPDFRRWGAGYWFMNQRLVYWPMLAAGDFDLMLPWLRMYRDSLDLQKHRTRTYFKHGGAHYPETIFFWGAEVSAHYGWTPFEQRAHPEAECPYLTYYWSGGIELTLILLEYFRYTGDKEFAHEFLLPIADAITEFFDLHYPRDERGKIRFTPAQSLETWHEATNPLPEIAGLRYVLPKLIDALSPLPVIRERVRVRALPSDDRMVDKRQPREPSLPPFHLAISANDGVPGEGESLLERWTRMLRELPEIPTGEKDGKRVILPAEKFDKKKNTENPELYSIFPYRLHGVGKPDLELARNTFEARLHKSHQCWSQDDIQMALLGMTDEAKAALIERASPEKHSDSRFPAFWNAFKDWCPDIDHGGVLQLALQYMLMQCEGREIRLLPAWPKEWDVDFKLHAPLQTTVEAKVRNGEIVELTVTPESRRADVVMG